MSYVIKAVLSNPRRPECGQITIPFPIPVDQYDQTIEMLQAADLGFSINRDCTVDGVDSRYNVLNALAGTLVNIDELDYLAKRLDGFCSGEVSQFQAMAHKLELTDIKDLINLTYCCQQATVITDFSDLGAVGRSHFLTVNGGSARMEDLENLDGEETAHLLIDGGGGVITPYAHTDHRFIATEIIKQCSEEQISAAPSRLLEQFAADKDYRTLSELAEKGISGGSSAARTLHMLTYEHRDNWIAEDMLEKRMWVDLDDYNALHACVQNDAVDVCKLLLDGGIDFDVYQQWAKNHPCAGHEETLQALADHWSEMQAERMPTQEIGGQTFG